MTAQSVFYFIATLIAAENIFASEWHYQDEGHWSSNCLKGKLQSPIDLSRSIAIEKEFHHFKLRGYGQTVGAILKNNGHSAEVRLNISDDNKPSIEDGGLHGLYELDHLHFHWQSEHTMDGYRFPLELHLVHYAKRYGDLKTALPHHRGVAVFAVLFELSPDDDEEFEPLLNIIETLQNQVNKPMELKSITVKNFLPRDLAGFYRYEGSLTTPGCDEGILWTVFTNTIPISEKQVKIFQDMHTNDKTVLRQNFRSTQPLNGRRVYVKISPIRSYSSAKTAEVSYLLLISFFALIRYVVRH